MALIKFRHLFSLNYIFVALSSLNFSAPQVETSFSPALATWYGDPNGAGSDGGACGYGADVGQPLFAAMVSAGNHNLFKSGKGCGACYQVKCTENSACSRNPVTVTITDECPGVCFNSSPVHFDLSGTAFGAMALAGQADALRKAGLLNIDYKRVPCIYSGSTTLAVKIDTSSNLNYFACVLEYVPGDGELSLVKLRPANSNWLLLKQSWGATWETQLPSGSQAPFSISYTTFESNYTYGVMDMIPVDWVPGKTYYAVSD